MNENMFVSRGAWLLFAVLSTFGLASPVPGGEPCFKTFDATRFTGKPNLQALGLQKITLKSAKAWWAPGESHDEWPKSTRLEQWAGKMRDTNTVLVIDLEHWVEEGDPAAVARTVAGLKDIVRRIRAAGFAGKLGYYGVIPTRDYFRAVGRRGAGGFSSWQAANDRLAAVVDSVDILFPSLYTFYDDPVGWKRYAEANIAEARRIAKGKPVVPFLWPRFHSNGSDSEPSYIPAADWQKQLELVASLADGVVIWTRKGSDTPPPWDNNAAWWRVTKDFVAANLAKCQRMPKPPELINTSE